MAWTRFSYEAIELDAKVRRLNKDGRMSDAIKVIFEALEKAHLSGPANVTYEQAEREWAAKADD